MASKEVKGAAQQSPCDPESPELRVDPDLGDKAGTRRGAPRKVETLDRQRSHDPLFGQFRHERCDLGIRNPAEKLAAKGRIAGFGPDVGTDPCTSADLCSATGLCTVADLCTGVGRAGDLVCIQQP